MSFDETTRNVIIPDNWFNLIVLLIVTAWCLTLWLAFRLGLDVGRDEWYGRHNHDNCPKEDPDGHDRREGADR